MTARTGHGYVWCKNLALNIGDCVSLVTQTITLMSIPSHLIGDVKQQLRTTYTLAVTTLSDHPGSDHPQCQYIKVDLAIMFCKSLAILMRHRNNIPFSNHNIQSSQLIEHSWKQLELEGITCSVMNPTLQTRAGSVTLHVNTSYEITHYCRQTTHMTAPCLPVGMSMVRVG